MFSLLVLFLLFVVCVLLCFVNVFCVVCVSFDVSVVLLFLRCTYYICMFLFLDCFVLLFVLCLILL